MNKVICCTLSVATSACFSGFGFAMFTFLCLSAVRTLSRRICRRRRVCRGHREPAVWRWQQRYGEEGVDGLLRDKTRPPTEPATVAEVLALTCCEPPGQATHWTGRAVAKAVGHLAPYSAAHLGGPSPAAARVRTFERSSDPAFAEKVTEIVGLHMTPPAHAVVLSIDEKSQIQALNPARAAAEAGQGRNRDA
jgi:hypothetical protein